MKRLFIPAIALTCLTGCAGDKVTLLCATRDDALFSAQQLTDLDLSTATGASLSGAVVTLDSAVSRIVEETGSMSPVLTATLTTLRTATGGLDDEAPVGELRGLVESSITTIDALLPQVAAAVVCDEPG